MPLRKRIGIMGVGCWSASRVSNPLLCAMLRNVLPIHHRHNKPLFRGLSVVTRGEFTQRFRLLQAYAYIIPRFLAEKLAKFQKKSGAIAPPVLSFFILRLFLFPFFYERLIELFLCRLSCRRSLFYRIKISKVKLLATKTYIRPVSAPALTIRHAANAGTAAACCRCCADLIYIRTFVQLRSTCLYCLSSHLAPT